MESGSFLPSSTPATAQPSPTRATSSAASAPSPTRAPSPAAVATPDHIAVRGARVHNLRDVDVDIPLNRLVGIAGVSGSGKSSLALGVLYAEGSRRYLEALSTYTRRRLTQSQKAQVDLVEHVPAALALHQRPAVPGIRSTFGTSTELLNSLRLLFSRVGSHACPNCGHHAAPSFDVALMRPTTCENCGTQFCGPGAEELAFNSDGACPRCQGTGVVRAVDESTLVPDESLSIEDGAVASWNQLMWSLMPTVAREMGVRIDVPFRELTPQERDIVFHGPAQKKHILYQSKTGTFAELDFTYFNAVYTVENSLSKAKDEKALARVAKFLSEQTCPDCHGSRLSPRALGSTVRGIDLAQAAKKTLDELVVWVEGVPDSLPCELRPMARDIVDTLREPARRLQALGLGYLALDRASSTLSTGERQRVQLARAVRNRTTGVLYVLDEPSIGLHPANVDGLLETTRDLLRDGNSVVMVDHDVRALRAADWIVEVGPGSGTEGGTILAQGTVAQVAANPASRIGGFLSGRRRVTRAGTSGGICDGTSGARTQRTGDAGARAGVASSGGTVGDAGAAQPPADVFADGAIHLQTDAIHTVKPIDLAIPRGRLVAVTGVSGSGKTTLVLESLVPALQSSIAGRKLPVHVRGVDAPGIVRVNLIDATPIGANVRSTVATYSGVLDDLRRAYAALPAARERGLKAGDFSYNTGSLRCPTCDGTGSISLDVQFLPDVEVACPDCGGSRYAPSALEVDLGHSGATGLALPQLLALTVDSTLEVAGLPKGARAKLQTLHDLGLGYLTLGEATPALSGGEAQRLKLASEIGRDQTGALFVFDEPTIGLHPLDVEVLLGVFDRLVRNGATLVVIEHDLDLIANADYVVDMGPGGGEQGGRIVCCGTPAQVAANPASVTGRYLGQG